MSKSTPFFKDVTLEGKKENRRKILVIAGVHGNEQNAVLAAYRLYESFATATQDIYKNENDIRFILGVNKWGLLTNKREFGQRTDVYPDPIQTDKPIDFNRVFTKNHVAELNENATAVRNFIQKAIEDADIVIDVHNSPACTNMVLLNNDEYAASTIEFMNECHMDTDYMVCESQTSTIKKYAIEQGKVGFTVELGGMTLGGLQDSTIILDQFAFLKTLVSWLDQFMPKFKKGALLPPAQLSMPIYAHAYGLIDKVNFHRCAPLKKGEVFATMITDSDNPDDAEFKAPCDGFLVACEDHRAVKPGDEIFYWQPVVNG